MPSNACFGFDTTTGWTFFDLNTLHDEYKNETGTVVEADFVSLPPPFSTRPHSPIIEGVTCDDGVFLGGGSYEVMRTYSWDISQIR